MGRIAVRLLIRGRVQGVGYRWWARVEARRLGLDGWVRNRLDGSVEIVAVGAAEAVAEMEELCRRGPRAARVNAIDRSGASDDGVQPGFDERPTG